MGGTIGLSGDPIGDLKKLQIQVEAAKAAKKAADDKATSDAAAAKAAADAAAAAANAANQKKATDLGLSANAIQVNGVWVLPNQKYIDTQNIVNQYAPKYKTLQDQIDAANDENNQIKNANPLTWNINSDQKQKIKENEDKVGALRKQIDDLNTTTDAAKKAISDNQVAQYTDPTGAEIFDMAKYTTSGVDAKTGLPIGYNIKTGTTGNTGDFGTLTPDEWLDKIYNQLMPTYSEKIKNESGPEVMDAYTASLNSQYGKDYKTTLENAAARGVSASGITGQQLSDLLATKNVNIQNKENDINDQLQSYLESLAQNGYNTSVKSISQNLLDEFKASGQTWDQFYNENQTKINNDLNEQASQTGIDFTKYQNDANTSNQEYLDQLAAISNLFGAAGTTAGSVAGSKTSTSTPLTQEVMPITYNSSSGYTGGIKNSALNDLTNTLNTNKDTGETFDLYTPNKNYLGY